MDTICGHGNEIATCPKCNPPELHPWEDFLRARMRAIAWLRREGKTSAEIARTLSMDGPEHVDRLVITLHREN
jgi:N-acetyl-anhydromuramyl-L-alanine amidase AmpD